MKNEDVNIEALQAHPVNSYIPMPMSPAEGVQPRHNQVLPISAGVLLQIHDTERNGEPTDLQSDSFNMQLAPFMTNLSPWTWRVESSSPPPRLAQTRNNLFIAGVWHFENIIIAQSHSNRHGRRSLPST